MILVNFADSILLVKCKKIFLLARKIFNLSHIRTLENLQIKNNILEMINDPEPTVKEQALVAIQKMMLHSWQAANVTGAQ